jgi:hypothetical protein
LILPAWLVPTRWSNSRIALSELVTPRPDGRRCRPRWRRVQPWRIGWQREAPVEFQCRPRP